MEQQLHKEFVKFRTYQRRDGEWNHESVMIARIGKLNKGFLVNDGRINTHITIEWNQ